MLEVVAAVLLLGAPARVGVVSLGDTAPAGELQDKLERSLQSRSVSAGGAAPLAPVLAAARETPRGASPPESEKLFTQAVDAYYEGSIPFALDRLSALAALQERTAGIPIADRIRLHLWRTAVYWALKDEVHAGEEASAALELSPELTVDLTTFPPSVADIVERQRPKLTKFILLFTSLPPGGRVTVDDRPVTLPAKIAGGRRRISVTAPGRRELVTVVDVKQNVSLPGLLPYELAAPYEAALLAVATTGSIASEHEPALADLGRKTSLDAIVVTITNAGETRAAIVSLPRGPVALRAPVRGTAPEAIDAWVKATLTRETRPPRPPRPPGPPLTLAPQAGLLYAHRTRTLDGGRALKTPFAGAGASAGLSATRGNLLGDLDVRFIQYSLSTVTVALPDDTRRKVSGGSTLALGLSGGWRQPVSERFAAHGALGVAFEQHDAESVRDTGGNDGLLPSYTRTALVARGGGRFEVQDGLAILGEVSLAPVSSWTETPDGASGKDPKGALAFGWTLGTSWTRGALRSALEYSGESRSVAFSGAAETPVAENDATVSELVHVVRVTAGWRF